MHAIADGFLRWYDGGPADIGIQTSAVLSATRRRLDEGETGTARVMSEEAAAYTLKHLRSAGDGALMRNSPVALAHLGDRNRCAEVARDVAMLTHADPLAGDSCVMWSEAIRLAVLESSACWVMLRRRVVDRSSGACTTRLLPARNCSSSWSKQPLDLAGDVKGAPVVHEPAHPKRPVDQVDQSLGRLRSSASIPGPLISTSLATSGATSDSSRIS